MFRKIPFVKSELDVIGMTPGFGQRPGSPIRNTPVTPRENIISLYYDKKPFWMPYFSELLDDVNNWKEKIIIPDISDWGWEEEAKAVSLDPRFSHEMSLVNGFWFERLISFMDFMEAAVALIDEEQEDAIKELFAATTDLA